jgi:hypothetical protein
MIDGLEPCPTMKESGVSWLGAVPDALSLVLLLLGVTTFSTATWAMSGLG